MQKKWMWIVTTVCCIAATAQVFAKPGDGIVLGNSSSLTPYVILGAGFEDNATLDVSGQEQDDSFYTLSAGLDFDTMGSWGALALRGTYATRSYDTFSNRDSDAFRESLQFVFGDPERLGITFQQAFTFQSDNILDENSAGIRPNAITSFDDILMEGSSIGRDRAQQSYGVNIQKDLPKLKTALGADYDLAKYPDNDGADWDQVQARMNLGYPVANKTDATLSASAARQNADTLSDGIDNVALRVGAHYAIAAKTDVSASFGYRVSQSTGSMEDDAVDQEGFDYSIRAMWRATERISAYLNARSDFLPSELYARNTRRVDTGSIGASYGINSVSASLQGQYRHDNYNAPINGEQDPSQDTVNVIGAVGYSLPRDWLRLTASASYNTFASNFENEFDTLRFMLTARAQY